LAALHGIPTLTAKSGETVHPILVRMSDPTNTVESIVLSVLREDFLRVDAYETKEYRRIEVDLVSGERSWVYVSAASNIF
jgi:hypothetical protein